MIILGMVTRKGSSNKRGKKIKSRKFGVVTQTYNAGKTKRPSEEKRYVT